MTPLQTKPLAERLEDILRQRLREGFYAPGSRMPSESDLAEEFGISRATVRTVLAKLAARGLVLRRHGEGTYVSAHVQEALTHFGNVWDFNVLIESSGFTPAIRLLARESRPATETEARALALEPGTTLFSFWRLFYADDRPVILANNLCPAALFRQPLEAVDGALHIRELLRRYCQREIAFAVTDIHAVQADALAASHLGKPVGMPLLALDIAFYSQHNEPLAIGRSYFDDTSLRLSLVQAWR